MSFSSAVIVAILFFCISDASASVIPDGKTVEYENSKEFKVHITERGTKYAEKILIEEENDLEYFHVPAHNGLTEADYLYDFRSNISVRRENNKASCYLGPLPDYMPKPSDLKTELQRESKAPSRRTVIVRRYWIVSEEVDKTLLRQEVQDFCGQFPVFRLEEVDLRSLAAGFRSDVSRTRFARNYILKFGKKDVPYCEKSNFPDSKQCGPNKWLFSMELRDSHCTWWITDCKRQGLTLCREWEHKYDSVICYKVRCP